MDEGLLLSFDELEERHWWFVVRRRMVLETVRRWAPADTSRILEVGCGTGATLRDLSAIFPDARVSGVEPVEEAARAASRKGCDVTVGAFEGLPAEPGSVDLFLTLDVLEHLDDDVAGLKEAALAMRQGGRIIATVPALPSLWGPHDEQNHHRRRYRRPGLVAALETAGFRVERVTYFNSLLLPLGYVERLAARALRLESDPAVALPSKPVNAVLRGIFGLETALLRALDLPLGMSLLIVATKP